MALSLVLGESGFTPAYVDVTAEVTLMPHGKGFKITRSRLKCEERVSNIDRATFMQHAETAKTNCPVSQGLAGVGISLEVTLLMP
jgi:osmotically inducible protein OsmC